MPRDRTLSTFSTDKWPDAQAAHFPFGTCPKWVEPSGDGQPDLVINQSNAILRHLARKANLYGRTPAEAALVDVWLDHCEDLRKAYNDVVYGLDAPPFDERLTNSDQPAVAAFAAHAPSVATGFGAFEARLEAAQVQVMSGGRVLVGDGLTVADVALYDLFDVHLRLWPNALAAHKGFARLHQHRAHIEAQPPIAAYLAGPRWSRINGNALG